VVEYPLKELAEKSRKFRAVHGFEPMYVSCHQLMFCKRLVKALTQAGQGFR
jgi:hypothetical protein